MAAQVVHTQPVPGATYYPQAVPNVIYVPQQRQPKYQYIPNDFMTFTLITAIFCGFFSPLTLMFTIPAYIFSRKSQLSAKMGDIRLARDQGMVSAYLNVTAVIFALVIAAVAIGVAIGVYGPTYFLQQCIELARSRGQDPASSYSSSYSYSYGNRCY